MMKVSVPEGWKETFASIKRIFENTSSSWIVGGMSRYMLFGGPEPEDMDIVIFSSTEKTKAAEALKTLAGPPQVIREGEILRFTLNGKAVELVQPKGKSPEDDALLRDFTFNAVYIHPSTFHIRDPLNALSHVKKGLLVTCNRPEVTLSQEPVRMIRMARFSVEFNLNIHRDVLAASTRLKGLLRTVPQERVGDQMKSILLSDSIFDIMLLIADLKLLEYVLPEMVRAVGFDQKTPYHFEDVYRHSIRTASLVEKDLALRCAALLHDSGKPYTARWKNNRLTYPGHESVSTHITRKVLRRWAFPKDVRAEAEELVKKHTVIYTPEWTDRAIRRFIRRTEGIREKLFKLVEADIKARGPLEKTESLEMLSELKARVQKIMEETPESKLRSPLNGHEIMEILGLEPGPLVGELKQALEDLVIEGTLDPDDKEGAKKILPELMKKRLNGKLI